MPFSGGCLCGAVRFEATCTFSRFFLCHCSYCRKDTGSAHAANLFANDAGFRWLSGEDRVVVFNLPGTRHTRSFCSCCGSALPTVHGGGKVLVVPAGSLDSDVPLRPQGHIFMDSRANWDQALQDVPMFPTFPG